MAVHTKGILMQNQIEFDDFPAAEIAAELPSLPFVIPAGERAKRRDFTKECVFTIDTKTARYE